MTQPRRGGLGRGLGALIPQAPAGDETPDAPLPVEGARFAELPVGVGVHLVADQPVIVKEAVSGFTRALFEAVVIVLAAVPAWMGARRPVAEILQAEMA